MPNEVISKSGPGTGPDRPETAWFLKCLQDFGYAIDGIEIEFPDPTVPIHRVMAWIDTGRSHAAILEVGPSPISGGWPGETAFFESLPDGDFPAPRRVRSSRNRDMDWACLVLKMPAARMDRAASDSGNRHLDSAVETLARIHARWWTPIAETPDGGRAFGQGALLRRDRDIATRAAAQIEDRIAPDSPWAIPENRRLIDDALRNRAAAKAARIQAGAPLTRVHGNPTPAALWLPAEDGEAGPYLTDWVEWRVDLAASDLVRAALTFENDGGPPLTAILDRYRNALVSHGVAPYPDASLLADLAAALPFEIAIGILRDGLRTVCPDRWRRLAGRIAAPDITGD